MVVEEVVRQSLGILELAGGAVLPVADSGSGVIAAAGFTAGSRGRVRFAGRHDGSGKKLRSNYAVPLAYREQLPSFGYAIGGLPPATIMPELPTSYASCIA